MRRGFLLDKPRKPKVPTDENQVPTKDNPQAQAPKEKPLVKAESVLPQNAYREELLYGKVEDTSLPTDFKPNWNIHIDAARGIVRSDRKTLVIVTVPPKGSKAAADENDHSEWITIEATTPRVFNAPGFPKPVPKPTGGAPACEVKMTPTMGMGVFATRDIKHGELVFAERPLLVKPINVNALQLGIPSGSRYHGFLFREEEKVLEAAVSRMSPANQAAFRALANSHTEDGSGPLTGIVRTNGYGVDEIFDGPGTEAADDSCRYSLIGDLASRINHSCMTNVFRRFDMAAFAFTFKASRDIKAGEQLFDSYCPTEDSAAARQRKLAPYGVVCNCRGCTDATPERDRFREEYVKRTKEFETLSLRELKLQSTAPNWPTKEQLQEILQFQAMAIEEGLHTRSEYQNVLSAIYLGYLKEGIPSKAAEALAMFEKNNGLFLKGR